MKIEKSPEYPDLLTAVDEEGRKYSWEESDHPDDGSIERFIEFLQGVVAWRKEKPEEKLAEFLCACHAECPLEQWPIRGLAKGILAFLEKDSGA